MPHSLGGGGGGRGASFPLLPFLPIDHSKGTKISKEGGEAKFFRCCGGRCRGENVEVLISIDKETYNTCNFLGWGEVWIS